MLYLPRLFVYHAGAIGGGEASKTFEIMEYKLLHGIMNPAAAVTILAGSWLAWDGYLWNDTWFRLKVGMVIALVAMHIFLARQVLAFRYDGNTYSSRFYRYLNEVPACIMLGIVALVIIKPWL